MSDKLSVETVSPSFHEIEYFTDLILMAVCLAGCVLGVYLPDLDALPLRYLLTIPVVLFVPGYSLTATLFPKNNDMTFSERIVLSFGFSIAVVPLIGLGLNFTPWGIRLEPMVISLTVFTLSMILIAFYRRVFLPAEERLTIPFRAFKGRIHDFFISGENKTDRLLSIVLVLVIVISVLTTMYVIIFPQEEEKYTEFFILGENRTADKYPGQIIQGQDYSMYVGVGNHEKGNINYTIETWLLREEFDAVTNSSHIILMNPNDHLLLALENNQTMIIPYNLSVKKREYNRVEFLLFKDRIPDPDVLGNSRINASYRRLNLWIQVE